MFITTKAIVLNSFKYGDDKIIVNLLTEQKGRLSSIVSFPKSGKGKVKRQHFRPLTLLEVIIFEPGASKLYKIKDSRLLKPLVSISSNPYKLSISIFIADFLGSLKRFDERDKELFSYIENSILWLEEAEKNFSNFHIVFLLRLTRFLGFYPNTEGYKEGFFFDLRDGCFTFKEPLHKDFLNPEDANKINLILRMDFPTISIFKLSRNERNLLLDVILEYYRLHLSLKLEIKSLEVLKSLFI